jgi:hypothetical protein
MPEVPADTECGPIPPKFAQLEAHERHMYTFQIVDSLAAPVTMSGVDVTLSRAPPCWRP